MSLRVRLLVFLAAVHVLPAVVAGLLLRQHAAWLLAIELAFAVSLGISLRLAWRLLQRASIGEEAARLIAEQELTTRLRPTGDDQIDRLIAVYNRMVDALREHRVRIQEQRHFLAEILQASPSGVIVLDYDGRVDEINPAAVQLLGVDPARTRGRTLEDLPDPVGSSIARLTPGQSLVVPTAGARRIRVYRGTFVDRGFVRHFLLLEELTGELRQAERSAYEKLIRVMSHEVNNTVAASNSLLQSIRSFGTSLSDADRPDFDRALAIVIARTEQLNQFLRRFADVYRLPPPLRQPVDLAELAAGLVALMRVRPGADRIVWRVERGAQPVMVWLDRGQIEQALVNILTNAIEAAGAGGAITVKISAEADGARLVVEDSGPGLSPEVREHLFTPFFSTKPQGQGVGLTLVQEILTAHGCRYGFDSHEGPPTRFTLTFPHHN